MMRLVLIVVFLVLSANFFAQTDSAQYGKIGINIGLNRLFIDNSNLNAWTEQQYNKKFRYTMDFLFFDLNILNRYHYDYGASVIVHRNFDIYAVYGGKELVYFKNFNSILNVETGLFEYGVWGVIPPNYTPDRTMGKESLHLNYNAWFCGLSWRNNIYAQLTKDRFCNMGMGLMAGYMPIPGSWEYGYRQKNGESSLFIGKKVTGIPRLSKSFLMATLYIGFAESMSHLKMIMNSE